MLLLPESPPEPWLWLQLLWTHILNPILQAFTSFRATFVVTWSFLGNTPTFYRCSISVARDGFFSPVGVPLGGESPLAQQISAVAASGLCTYTCLSFYAVCRIPQITLCSQFSQILSSKVLLQVFNSVTYWSTVSARMKRIGNVKMIHCFVGYTATFCHVYIFSYTFLSSSHWRHRDWGFRVSASFICTNCC